MIPKRDWKDFKSLYEGSIAGAREGFEDACYKLIRKENLGKSVNKIELNPGDEGIDVVIGDFTDDVDVYQCKFFPEKLEDSQKKQIRDSFNTAVKSEYFNITKWFLCIPKTLTIGERSWWGKWKSKKEKETKIKLMLLDGDELIERFKEQNIYSDIFQIKELKNLNNSLENIKTSISDMKRNLYLDIKTDILNSKYKENFEEIEKLIENLEIREAEKQLNKLEKETISSKENKYLYWFHKAKLEIKKGSFTKTSKAFKEASEFQENKNKKNILLAFSYLNDDELNDAERLVNNLLSEYDKLDDSDKVNVLSIKFATIKSIEDLENFINKNEFTLKIENSPNLNYSIGKVYSISGDFNKGLKYLNKAKDLKLQSKDLNLEISQMIIGKYQQIFNLTFGKEILNNEDLNFGIKTLENELLEVEDYNSQYNYQFFVALGIGYHITGKPEKGLELLEKIYKIRNNFLTCYNYSFNLNLNKKYDKMKEVIGSFFNKNDIYKNKDYKKYKGITELYLISLLETENYDEVLRISESYIDAIDNFDKISQEDINIFTALFNMLVHTKNNKIFNEYVKRFEKEFKDTNYYLDFLFLKANGLNRLGKKEEAISILDFIYNELEEKEFHKKLFDTNFNNTAFIEQLGDEFIQHSNDFYELKDHSNYLKNLNKAKYTYEGILIKNEPNSNTEKLLDIYTQKTGELNKALEICQKLRKKYGIIEKIAELEGIIYDQIGDLESAEILYEKYLKLYPNNKIRIHLGTIKDRLKKELNKDFFNDIKFANLTDKVSITNLSFLLLRNKKYKQALKLIYIQKRKDSTSKYWNDFYIKLFMNIDRKYVEKNFHDLNKVSLNTSITIINENKEKNTYLLINEDKSFLKDEEINLDNELAQKLIDKNKGESLEYDSIKYKIDKINNKYLYEYNKAMNLINNPKYKSDFLLKKGNGMDFLEKELTNISNSRNKFLYESIEKYWANFMSINQLSQYLGEDNYKTISYLKNTKKYGLFTFSSKEESNFEILNKSIVLDAISLISIHILKIENYISDNYDRIFVSNSSIDELESFKANYEGVFFDDNNNFLLKIIKWTRRNCKPKSIKKILEIPQKNYNYHTNILGKSFLDSILLAEQENAILYSDDFRFNKTVLDIENIKKETENSENKLFNFNLNAIKTTNSLELIETLYENKDITYDKLNEIKIEMLHNNYNFIIGNKDILIKAVELSNWKIEEDTLFYSSLILLNGNRYKEIYKQPLLYVLDLSINFIFELLSKEDVGLEKKYRVLLKTFEYLDSTSSTLEVSEFLMVKIEDAKKEANYKSELINILNFWQSNKDTKKINIEEYNEKLSNFLENNSIINEDSLISDIINKLLNGFNIKDLLEIIKSDHKIKKNKELSKILIGLIENDGNLSEFKDNKYYQKVLNTKINQMVFQSSRNSILSKIQNNKSMIKKLLLWVNSQIKINDDDKELQKFFNILKNYLKSKNIIEFNQGHLNNELAPGYNNLLKLALLDADRNFSSLLIKDTANYIKSQNGTLKDQLKRKIKNYKNIIKNEKSIIELDKSSIETLDFLLLILRGENFRSCKDKFDKKIYNLLYMQYLSISQKDIIEGFVVEAKKLKKDDPFNDLPNYFEVIETFITNDEMATRKIFVIIKEYLEDKDISKYKDDLLNGNIVKSLMED